MGESSSLFVQIAGTHGRSSRPWGAPTDGLAGISSGNGSRTSEICSSANEKGSLTSEIFSPSNEKDSRTS